MSAWLFGGRQAERRGQRAWGSGADVRSVAEEERMAVLRRGFAALALAFAGCGGSTDGDDDDGESCGAVEGCGGDVVGVWTVADLCMTGAPASDVPECEAAVSFGPIDASGQIELTADGQTVSMLDLTLHVTYNFTEECASAQAGQPVMLDAAACNLLETQLNQTENLTSVSCTLSGNSCVCPATFQT